MQQGVAKVEAGQQLSPHENDAGHHLAGGLMGARSQARNLGWPAIGTDTLVGRVEDVAFQCFGCAYPTGKPTG